MQDVIEIPLSKKKILLVLVGAIAFVVAGVFFIMYPETFVSTRYRNSTLIFIVGIVAVAFFGLCGIYAAVKLFDTGIGLKIDDKGITDNSSGVSVGLIEWQDITEIESIEISTIKMLLLMTNSPQKYIEKAKNPLSKQMLKSNHKTNGSPLTISTVGLKINFDDLEKLVNEEFNKRSQ